MPVKAKPFWDRVTKDGEDGCWLWTGGTLNGYGRFITYHTDFILAHRYAYMTLVDSIPEGVHLHHKCGNKLCVNPKHLQVVSPSQHISLPDGQAGKAAAKTHCKQGHELSGANLYITPDGRRQCITCRNERTRIFKGYNSTIKEKRHCPD